MENMNRKNECFSYDLQDVLVAFNAVKRTLQKRKYCYDECESQKIKEMFIQTLDIDLLTLSTKLMTWVSHGHKMEASEDSFDDLLE